MATRKTINEKLEAAKIEKEQAEARIKQLIQQQKSQERKDRHHRLCLRGGKLEKLLPELARLTEEQFEIFVEKCLLTSFTWRTLAELAPPEPEQPDGGQRDAAPNVRAAGTEDKNSRPASADAIVSGDSPPRVGAKRSYPCETRAHLYVLANVCDPSRAGGLPAAFRAGGPEIIGVPTKSADFVG